jgi:K+ transporter
MTAEPGIMPNALPHNASGTADFLNLPNNSVVELGSKVEI